MVVILRAPCSPQQRLARPAATASGRGYPFQDAAPAGPELDPGPARSRREGDAAVEHVDQLSVVDARHAELELDRSVRSVHGDHDALLESGCGRGSRGGRRLSPRGYVTGTGATREVSGGR
jgi:hypothetical protein